jgi:hypothetical protein
MLGAFTDSDEECEWFVASAGVIEHAAILKINKGMHELRLGATVMKGITFKVPM